jgi:hypothetical protein
MEPVTLPEAAVCLHKSERTIRRMVERGELEGKLLLEHGRYRWAIMLPETCTAAIPATEQPDVLAVLLRIEAKLDQILAAQSEEVPRFQAPAGTLPIVLEPVAKRQPTRRSWWQRIIWGPEVRL